MQPTADISFRVLTVNTHKGFAFLNRKFVLHELRDAVRVVGADIVFLQEVQGEHHLHSTRIGRWPEVPHYEFLADEIWPDFAYGRNAVYPHGDHGNALLSKFPIVAHENRDVSIDGHETRGLLHCTLRIPGREIPLHAICVHLGLKESHRLRQLELLGEVIRTHVPVDAPLLVAGDFNDWRCRAHATLERSTGLREVFVHANGRAAKTFPAHLPMLELDRIYVRNTKGNTPVPLPREPWSRLSDHAPLAAEIRV
ncbi:endonuclease/exonuclease/phosphatase family protein [Rhizobacter fulvus]|jgi:endonuclease/exonuclease/phosphatase family metal-dependent hydrolase